VVGGGPCLRCRPIYVRGRTRLDTLRRVRLKCPANRLFTHIRILPAVLDLCHPPGGCWNDNNVDDSPNDPIQDPNTGGEGGDCSGFTFKVWRESTNVNDSGAWQWNKLRNVHGPYVAGNFKSGYGAPHVTYWKGGLIRMDALASDSHVGMIYSANADGTDQMIEAKGEAYGTNIWTRTYRGDSSYGGARRLGWNA
jgi:hypothetical protein